MTAQLTASAPQVLRDYYRVLEGGETAYGDGAELRPLLSDHLDFTGPLAGHRPDSTEGFLKGVRGFIATVQAIDVIGEVHDPSCSVVMYRATMPKGPMVFAEVFTLADDRISSLHLVYNGAEYIALGGR